jgi:uncharacterized protein
MLCRAAAFVVCGSCLAACGGSASHAAADSGTTDLGSSDAACEAAGGSVEAGVSVTVDGGVLFGTAMNVDPCANRAEALIVAGSGATDRDGNDPPSLETNTYLELAAHFAEKDVSSIRYDKRGIGESAAAGPDEANLTFDEYVDDARAWVRSMRQAHPGVPVIMVGHSEGSLIGILASESEAVDALVSLEGAGRPAGEVLRSQLSAQLTGADLTTASSIIDELEAGRTVASVPTDLASVFRPSVQPYLISWFRYDPAVELAKLKIPVLVVQGTADLQVTAMDASLLAGAALHGTPATIENMTHPLKLATPSDPKQTAAYTDPSLPLAPALLPPLDSFVASSL